MADAATWKVAAAYAVYGFESRLPHQTLKPYEREGRTLPITHVSVAVIYQSP